MGRGDLTANPGGTLGDDWEAEPGYEDPFVEQKLAHPDGVGGLADDDGDDGCRSRDRLEAEVAQSGPEMTGVVVKGADPFGMGLEELDRGQRGGRDRGRKGV